MTQVLEPFYFGNVTKQMRTLDKIEVISEDMTWFAEFLILDVMSASVKLLLLNSHTLASVQRQSYENDLHKIEWLGAEGKFTVIRKLDSATILGGFSTIIDAQKWLIDHEKALKA